MIRIDPGYSPWPTAPRVPAVAPAAAVPRPEASAQMERRRGYDRRAGEVDRGLYEMRSGRDRRRGYPGGPVLDIEA